MHTHIYTYIYVSMYTYLLQVGDLDVDESFLEPVEALLD